MEHDLLIVGAGPAGLSLARALRGSGLRTTLIEQSPLESLQKPAFDGREIALTHPSRDTLQRLGSWGLLAAQGLSRNITRAHLIRIGEPLLTDRQGIYALAARGMRVLFIEGGGITVSRFFGAGALDRLHLAVAPVLIGQGRGALGDIGLTDLPQAHGRWQLQDTRLLGNDRMESYQRVR